MRQWIYGVGCPQGNEDVYTARFERHNREVLEYFADRPQDLLVMRLTEGDGWDKLCPFLGVPIPETPFPHENRAENREQMETQGSKPKPKPKPSMLGRIKRKILPGK
jgi:hypothetical protein